MKENQFHRFNGIRKSFVLITLSLFHTVQLLAASEDHGKWYSVDDSEYSSHSSGFYFTTYIIAAIIVVFLIISISKSKVHNMGEKGCLIALLIGLLIIGAFCLSGLLS